MKIIMYGAPICPDCVLDKEVLMKSNEVELDYRNITLDTKTLKEFLAYRDQDEIFKQIIDGGKIGIPFYILEDGTKTFDIYNYVDIDRPDSDSVANACSIDGKGNC